MTGQTNDKKRQKMEKRAAALRENLRKRKERDKEPSERKETGKDR